MQLPFAALSRKWSSGHTVQMFPWNAGPPIRAALPVALAEAGYDPWPDPNTQLIRYLALGEDTVQKQSCTLVLGVIEERTRLSDLHDPAFVHEDNAISNASRETHFVRDAEHCHAIFGKLGHRLQDFLHHLGIEC